MVRIDAYARIYSRCDAEGCDDLNATFSSSGEFIVIDVPARGMVAKMAKDGSAFTEVVTIATDVLVSFGSCR